MKQMRKKCCAVVLALALTLCAAACGSTQNSGTAPQTTQNPQATVTGTTTATGLLRAEDVTFDNEDAYTDWKNGTYTAITLTGDSAAAEGGGVSIAGGVVTISTGGTYVISGTLNDGQIVVETTAKDSVRLVLNGATIHSETSAAIYVKQADQVVVSMEAGTVNTLSDGAEHVLETDSDEPSAVLFSKDDLILNGSGTLKIEANYNDGITGKDDVTIMEGTFDITAVDDGIVGKDSVAVKTGTFTMDVGGDGIKATNDTDAEKGYVAILGGDYILTAGADGIQAESCVLVADGDLNIQTGGGSAGVTHAVQDKFSGKGGMGGMGGGHMMPGTTPSEQPADNGMAQQPAATTGETTEAETGSSKGIKGLTGVLVSGGSVLVDSADDSLHSNGSISIEGGTLQLSSGDDGVHADGLLSISGGNLTVAKSYEGLEGAAITLSGGSMDVTASDDGVNVSGGNDGSGMGTDSFDSSVDHILTITGGDLKVNADGDGLDSNGSITMSGGTVLVNGPTNSGNGALDYNSGFTISGGSLLAVDSGGMAQGIGSGSTQAAVELTLNGTQSAGSTVTVVDENGNEIASFAPNREFRWILVSNDKVQDGGSYTVLINGSEAGSATAATQGSSGMGGGKGGMKGGQMPSDGGTGVWQGGQKGARGDGNGTTDATTGATTQTTA